MHEAYNPEKLSSLLHLESIIDLVDADVGWLLMLVAVANTTIIYISI